MPSSILEHGYPLGAINLAGQTPIVPANDARALAGLSTHILYPQRHFGSWRNPGRAKIIDLWQSQSIPHITCAVDRLSSAARLIWKMYGSDAA